MVTIAAVGVTGVAQRADAAFLRATPNPGSTLNAASNFYPYKTAVLADSPYLHWRLAETSGTAIADSSSNGRPGTLSGSTYNQGQTGALVSETRDKALRLTTGIINANASTSGPAAFTVEAWVKTTSSAGGRILGFGDATGSAASSSVDRQLYLGSNGKVLFGVGSAKKTVASTAVVNNGSWHHVVGTFTTGTNGMKLYVDGALQGSATATTISLTGYWRAGFEQLAGWTNNPTSNYLDGTLDELAVYTSAQSAARVLAHYNAGVTP